MRRRAWASHRGHRFLRPSPVTRVSLWRDNLRRSRSAFPRHRAARRRLAHRDGARPWPQADWPGAVDETKNAPSGIAAAAPALSKRLGFGQGPTYHDRDDEVGTNNRLRGRRCAAPARGHKFFDRRGAHSRRNVTSKSRCIRESAMPGPIEPSRYRPPPGPQRFRQDHRTSAYLRLRLSTGRIRVQAPSRRNWSN
jgi:hypothetical protein